MEKTSLVIPVGIDFDFLDEQAPAGPRPSGPPLILWNHRWEHDKAPEDFFEALRALDREGLDFQVAVCGECFSDQPACFDEARRELAPRLRQWGYLPSRKEYARLLWQADVVVSTALQEFLGLSTLEALWCGCYPLLPNRLSYPELLPQTQRGRHLYSDKKGLIAALRELLQSTMPPRYVPRQDYLRPYAWSEVRNRLDQAVDALLLRRKVQQEL